MARLDLFGRDQIIGVFRGFREGGLEFHADLVLPYRHDFQRIPMHGQFLLVQLESPDEAVLGRIASFSSEGKLAFGSGEEFNIRAMRDGRPVPEDLREQYLKYKVNIRVLGVLRLDVDETLVFVPSHRRLPHVGSPVAFPSGEVLREIAGHNVAGAAIGHFALGEYIYAEGSADIGVEPWMQLKDPEVQVHFPVESLVARRSFVFARAGFGKSNLNKLLFSRLYATTPTVTKRGGRRVPVGTVLFDPDGEYFWPDDKGRPGLCDVPELEDKLVVFTSRRAPSPFYQSFVAGGIKLDIRRLRPADVIGIALSPERQEQQNVRKLAGLSPDRWETLVNLIDANGNATPLPDLCALLGIEERQEAEAVAARSNMTTIVRQLHDRGSQLMDLLIRALSLGKLCVVDVSQLRGTQALILSGLILRRIFDRNQDEFTAAEPRTIPTIAVVEEAQSVLNERSSAAEPYIAWVKEGRKYDLGALLITQQPGSIPVDILSQGDNWFIFHLLSETDLTNVRRANAHFSEDLLSALLNEPIPGQGVFWSSVAGKPYPVSVRVLSFERLYHLRDPHYNAPAADTFATTLRREAAAMVAEPVQPSLFSGAAVNGQASRTAVIATTEGDSGEAGGADPLEVYKRKAIAALETNAEILRQLGGQGYSWGGLRKLIAGALPTTIDNPGQLAYDLIPKVLIAVFGPRDVGWHSFKNPRTNATWVRSGPQEAEHV